MCMSNGTESNGEIQHETQTKTSGGERHQRPPNSFCSNGGTGRSTSPNPSVFRVRKDTVQRCEWGNTLAMPQSRSLPAIHNLGSRRLVAGVAAIHEENETTISKIGGGMTTQAIGVHEVQSAPFNYSRSFRMRRPPTLMWRSGCGLMALSVRVVRVQNESLPEKATSDYMLAFRATGSLR